MPYQVDNRRSKRKARKVINIHQNRFPKGYISTFADSRRPQDSLSDLKNMEIVQDNVVRPRPPLTPYGEQPTLTVIGRAMIRYGGNRTIIWGMNDSGTGKIYKQSDGGTISAALSGVTYDSSAWIQGVQSKNRCYLYNSVDTLSYIDLTDDSLNQYTALSTPVANTPTKTGMTGTSFNHYYRVSANNDVGESIASVAVTVPSGKVRNSWIEDTDYITLTWSTVTNATSYTIYYGDTAAVTNELYTVGGNGTVTFTDYGTLATNPFKQAPDGNSTAGAIFTHMYVDSKNAQIFGVTADNLLYYSAPGTGDFSPYEGGGYVAIDEDGDTELNYVTGFRTGKGDPVITISARGAAGKGKLFHVTFATLTVGDQAITYPNVFEANGEAGTYAPRATVKERDALWYPTGEDFKTTGTSQNVSNILTTRSLTQTIENDVDNIDLDNLHKAVGVAYREKIFFALPVGSTSNSEIWYIDLARKNLWVLRWPIAADDMWLYEDNDGSTHFCVLVNNKVLEFTRVAKAHQDDNVPWSSRVAFSSLVWDEDGLSLGKIRNQYFKLLQPRGLITANATGLTRTGVQDSAGSDSFTSTTTATGIGQWLYGGALLQKNKAWKYGDDVGNIDSYGKSVAVLKIKPRGLLAQLDWEVVADTGGVDYILSAVNTRGHALDQLTLKND